MVGVSLNDNENLKKNVPTAEDQQQINKFARLHKSYLENKDQLAFLQNTAQNLTDAENEVMLMEDGQLNVPILVGSIFVHQDQDKINLMLEERKEYIQQQIDSLGEKIICLEAEMKDLRAILYAKFGDNIQLEDEQNNGE
uniref:Prefoldin subunit 4 n=1 Tax=Meloidogyne enterolobii TaxID=390850 RepID=A0A6V7V2F1_MELEN|nr:unnamed protein product [Meloidogyne enterolobii]